MLLKLASVTVLSAMGAGVKLLGEAIPPGQTMFFRGALTALMLALIARQRGELGLLLTSNWRGHAARSVFGTVSMFGWFLALTMIPFADLTALVFSAPLFLTVLAMLFLKERIHGFRWTALAFGFAGMLIMMGPHLNFGQASALGVAIALGAAVTSAVAQLFLRSMSGNEHAITITFYFSLTMLVLSAFTALWGWPMPSAQQWLMILGIGLLGAIGQLLLTYAYRYAEASTIAPLDYANLIFAALLGYWLFGEKPGVATWIGAPLVVASGSLILWREYALLREGRRRPP